MQLKYPIMLSKRNGACCGNKLDIAKREMGMSPNENDATLATNFADCQRINDVHDGHCRDQRSRIDNGK